MTERQEKLNKLAGMVYANGQYTPEEWEEKTGVNPRGIFGIVQNSQGKCIWTLGVEKEFEKYCQQVKKNWQVLGI